MFGRRSFASTCAVLGIERKALFAKVRNKVSEATISNSFTKGCSPESFEIICDALGVPPEELVRADDIDKLGVYVSPDTSDSLICHLAGCKLSSDLSHSLLGNRGNSDKVIEYATRAMKAAGLWNPKRAHWVRCSTGPSEWNAHRLAAEAQLSARQWLISCAPNSVAIYATLQLMRRESSADIKIDSRFGTGAEQLQAIQKGVTSPDFIAVGLPAFFLNTSQSLKNYRLILIPNWEAQSVFSGVKDSTRNSGQLLVAQGSAAEVQERADHPLPWLERRPIDPFRVGEIMRRLEPGQSIIAWESLAKPIKERGFAKLIKGTDYKILVGLYCRSDLLRTKRYALAVEAFSNLFVAAWAKLSDRAILTRAVELLRRDQTFIRDYGRSSGAIEL